ncbi:hypothetical protein FAEPRAA2165_02413 [Faecalibacterium duncaniae]|uniref:Uncharacterized protein n=1 Tax=Faecalibacterium duncaniae (strain DSM 17677 / JCM 31915 / A2-165) TaxID=411483 RepID=C7H7X8_FAED2|nr:hypothetical protein FAEPRAA2165_02413 [Faecalibacterium duncaniae]
MFRLFCKWGLWHPSENDFHYCSCCSCKNEVYYFYIRPMQNSRAVQEGTPDE